MRIISPAALKPGMVLAKSIYDNNGLVMVREGTSLTDNTAVRLESLGIPLVYIEDPRFDDLEVVKRPTLNSCAKSSRFDTPLGRTSLRIEPPRMCILIWKLARAWRNGWSTWRGNPRPRIST